MNSPTHFDKWTLAYKRFKDEEIELNWPTESLVRLLRGSYVPGHDPNLAGKSVIDVGFGNGNNLMLYSSLGMQISGIEVSQDICDIASDRMRSMGCDTDLRVGTNTDSPFDDNSADFLVSWNVLHYEENRQAVGRALMEYRRVLKPGGRVIISTVGPRSQVIKGGTDLGEGLIRIEREDDFRKGKIFCRFQTEAELNEFAGQYYNDAMTGWVTDFLFTGSNDSLLFTGLKP